MRPTHPEDLDKPALLLRCSTEFEAGLRASTVRAAGFDARVIQAAGATLNFGAATGAPFEVYVHSKDLDAARAALTDAAAGNPTFAEESRSDPLPIGEAASRFTFGAGTAFVVGLAFGLFTVFIPFTLAMLLKAPLSPADRNILGVLWVLFFGMVGVVLRERFSIVARGDDGDEP